MKTKAFLTMIMIVLAGNFCFSQPENDRMGPPIPQEQLKMINDKICKPLNLDNSQTEKVTSAFKDFFEGMEKLVDKSTNPPTRPEKSKIDALAKIRDEKVKLSIPAVLFPKYVELELATRPKGPEDGGHRPNKH